MQETSSLVPNYLQAFITKISQVTRQHIHVGELRLLAKGRVLVTQVANLATNILMSVTTSENVGVLASISGVISCPAFLLGM